MNKKNKYKLISYRKRILNQLKKITNYDYDARCSLAYNGEGFYVNHKDKVILEQSIWGSDKHWAYGGALKYNNFPLSIRLRAGGEGELGIFSIKYTYMNPRYTDFNYSIFKNQPYKEIDGYKYIYLTNLDYEIFADMYETDAKIVEKYWFEDIGKLGLEDLIDEAYKDKKSGEYDKIIFESAFYGLFAKKLLKMKWNRLVKDYLPDMSLDEAVEYEVAYARTACTRVRKKEVPIAMFQAAYLRYEEWQLFKNFKYKIVYMNTDSIYTDMPHVVEEDRGIGCYGIEFENKPVQWIRRNAYVVKNEDGSIYKTVIGGIIDADTITIEELETLKNPDTVVIKHTLDADGNVIEYELRPSFINDAARE